MTTDDAYYYWDRGDGSKLTNYFKASEFECRCGCLKQRISKALLERLDDIREDLGDPIQIHSGFRCAAKQAQLATQGYETAKGVSQHELGNAADVSAVGMGELLQLLRGKFKAIGTARTFCHVDIRDDKQRYWSYSSM